MKIYLDNSVLNRLFDDPDTHLNRLEAEALLSILKLIEKGEVALVGSATVEAELSELFKLTTYDALHVAAAEASKANVLITCDASLIKKYRGDLLITDPITFLKNYDHNN